MKQKAAVPASEKREAGKVLNLSLSATKDVPLERLPGDFREHNELRKLDLSGQTKLGAELPQIRFAGGTLTWLNLSGVDAAATKWTFLTLLKTLFVLNVSHCNLDALPKELASVTSLKALVASHNRVTSPSLSSLSTLTALNTLVVSDNSLTSLPSTLANLQELKKLSIANNQIRSDGLPDLSLLSALEELRLNGNAGIASLPESLCACQNLSLLELSHTRLSNFDEVEKLKRLPKLVNLALRGTVLADASDYRTKVTKMLPKLRILDNTRFDESFLRRKDKQRKMLGQFDENSASTTSPKPIKPQQPENGVDRKRKAARMDEPMESDMSIDSGTTDHKERRKKRLSKTEKALRDGKPLRHDDSLQAAQRDSGEGDESDTAHGQKDMSVEPKKKRSRYRKRLEKQSETPGEGRAQFAGGKTAKSVGGSLSGPAEEVTEPQESVKAATESLEELAKKRSSVVGVIDATKSAEKGKVKKNAKPRTSLDTTNEDVLALLRKEQESHQIVRGWD